MITCLCKGVSDKVIKELAPKCASLKEVSKACGAGTKCGKCIKEIKEIIKKKDK